MDAHLLVEFERIVGRAGIVRDPDELITYECDGLVHQRATAQAVALPGSAAQVQALVRLCNREGVPFVARGHGTGLSGGATPVEGGLVIALARLNRVLEIDLPNRRVAVEPCVTNLEITRRVAPQGYYYAPDPSSQSACSIGGNGAENSGGAHCLKYGFTTHQRFVRFAFLTTMFPACAVALLLSACRTSEPQPALRSAVIHTHVPGARVWLSGAGVPEMNLVTDVNGDTPTFTLPSNIPAFNVHAEKAGAAPYGGFVVRVETGTRPLDVFFGECSGGCRAGDHAIFVGQSWQETPIAWSEAQLTFLQGDLMIWAPALALTCDGTGEDPRARIRCAGAGGEIPRGLQAGWVWGVSVVRYTNPADRETLYQAARQAGHTHYQVAVGSCAPGEGYHGLYPETAETCATAASRVNAVLRELLAHQLIPMCVGASPDDPVLPGLDHSLCKVVGDDWDNSMAKDCRLDFLAREFTGAPIFLWRLAEAHAIAADACSPQPFPDSVERWLRAAQQRVPAFVGIFHEVNIPTGEAAATADLTQAHAAFRGVIEVLGESDTYWKFWQGSAPDTTRTANDTMRSRLRWLVGCFSGCSPQPVPTGADGAR